SAYAVDDTTLTVTLKNTGYYAKAFTFSEATNTANAALTKITASNTEIRALPLRPDRLFQPFDKAVNDSITADVLHRTIAECGLKQRQVIFLMAIVHCLFPFIYFYFLLFSFILLYSLLFFSHLRNYNLFFTYPTYSIISWLFLPTYSIFGQC
ncbi:MAG: hypothetical protein IJR34_01705, partial [Bacteroidales bacterium]|nr:hypothetical protein [Bacteroidales bacterium]